MAGFKANSEIIGIFWKISYHCDSWAEESVKVRSNFEFWISSAKMTFYAEFIKKIEKSHFEELIPNSKFDFTFADFSAVESFCGTRFGL